MAFLCLAAREQQVILSSSSKSNLHPSPTSPNCGIFFNEKDAVLFMETMTRQTELMSQLYAGQLGLAN